MTRLSDLLDYLDSCSDGQFLKFCDAMEKRGYKYVTQYVYDYEYPHVIRCKDCKHFDGFDCNRYADETYGISHSTQPYGFCWVAERKDNGESN